MEVGDVAQTGATYCQLYECCAGGCSGKRKVLPDHCYDVAVYCSSDSPAYRQNDRGMAGPDLQDAGALDVQCVSFSGAEFPQDLPQKFLDELALRDLEAFQEAMLDEEFGDETIKGRLTNLCVFLHAYSIPLTLSHEAAKKDVEAYTPEEYKALYDASTEEERQVWEFLKKTGFRKGENAHACYTDIRPQDGAIRVRAKPQYNDWKPKSKKGYRNVPIPDDLIEMLRARQIAHPDDKLIFPDKDGLPSGSRFLRLLKIRAWRAGLKLRRLRRAGRGQGCFLR